VGHTKVRCTKPLVEDDDTAGFGGGSYGGGFGTSGGEAGANDGGGDFPASNYGAEAASDPPVAAGDWGASTGGSVNW
jgi:hypothetical protein